jgi:hypothetical protein
MKELLSHGCRKYLVVRGQATLPYLLFSPLLFAHPEIANPKLRIRNRNSGSAIDKRQ